MTVSRKQQKAETRRKLLDAAIDELASGRSFDTLSLREVARSAGIAPTSFYRHFHDMESLGLALIEEGGESLRNLMRDARDHTSEGKPLIRASVETLVSYFNQNSGISRMVMQESMSRQPIFRKAAERLIRKLSKDLAEYLTMEADQRGVPIGHAQLAAEAMVAMLFNEGVSMLNKSANDTSKQTEAIVIKLKMIMLGAEAMGQRN